MAVVGSLQTRSQVQVRYLDWPAMPTTPAIVMPCASINCWALLKRLMYCTDVIVCLICSATRYLGDHCYYYTANNASCKIGVRSKPRVWIHLRVLTAA